MANGCAPDVAPATATATAVPFFRLTPPLPQQQARLPADALGAGAQLLQRPVLNLADAFLADPQQVADLPQAVRAVAGQAEAQVQHLAFARPQVLHQETDRLLTFGIGALRRAVVIGHRL